LATTTYNLGSDGINCMGYRNMILILCLILQEPVSLSDVDVIPYEEER